MLMNRANNFLATSKSDVVNCHMFYRNKPKDYFDHIFDNCDGVMTPLIKDFNADPGSCLNGQLAGLFFGAKVSSITGLPPEKSPYGDTRVHIPVDLMFTLNINLYFADFYCITGNKKHYATLVMTLKESQADLFCRDRLPALNPFNNPFLWRDTFSGRVVTCTRIFVEIFYTDSINLYMLMQFIPQPFSKTETMGSGYIRYTGMNKDPKCKICNSWLGDDTPDL